MKKFLSFFLALILLLPCVSTVIADDDFERAYLIEGAKNSLYSYYFIAAALGGTFNEGSAPDIGTLFMFFADEINTRFEDYVSESTEDGWPIRYDVPFEVFESFVGERFVLTNDFIASLRSSAYYVSDTEAPYYTIPYIGGFGGPEFDEIVFQDVEIMDDGNILCRAYTAYVGESVYEGDKEYFNFYVPGVGAVEGVDYIMIPYTHYYFDENTLDLIEYFSYIPGKLTGGYECIMQDCDGTWKYLSYTRIEKDNVPFTSPLKHEVNEYDRESIYFGNGFFEFCPADLTDNTVLSCSDIGYEGLSEAAAAALENLGNIYSVTRFSVDVGGMSDISSSPIPASLFVPFFARDVRLYYITDTGDVSEIEGTFDIENYMFYTAFSSIGTVAMLYDPLFTGDVNADGKINIQDAGFILKYTAGWDTYVNPYSSDVNGDEKINLLDASTLLKYVAGWDIVFSPNLGA